MLKSLILLSICGIFSTPFLGLEKRAEKKGKGLWSEGNVISPWDYRERNQVSSDSNKIYHTVNSFTGEGGGGKPSQTGDDCRKMEDSIDQSTCMQKLFYLIHEESMRTRTSCTGTVEARIECKGENLKNMMKLREKYKVLPD